MNKEWEKKCLRQEVKKQVAKLTQEYCQQSDNSIIENLLNTYEYQKANCIFCYVGTKREINTMPILVDALKRGKMVGIPKCIKAGVMKVYRIHNISDLKPGAYGIMEPDQSCQILSPDELELVIVPCLSCTVKGVRLGYGGGYYDRYLTQTNSPKIVLCREKSLKREIPKDPHDLLMDLLITEKGIILC